MFIALGVIVVLLAVAAASRGYADQGSGSTPRHALDVLDERLARGEVSRSEHARRREVLLVNDTASSTPGRVRRPWLLVGSALAVVALVAALGVGWNGMATGWGWMGPASVGSHMGWSGTTTSEADAFIDAREVTVEMGDLWYEPERIEVTVGEEVNVRVVNTGRVFHDLTVPAAELVLGVEPGEEVTGGLIMAEPGRYDFFCSVPGHADGGMRGTIVVSDGAG